ncbi:hypothetical protein HJFPF1_02488 [Paramyrothecium foliicola]|nr:hypothetical protein HJFPF1_02488 [Paramyrothecium foliicola]
MPKQRRKPACDPCRSSKLACDHAQPVCSRCRVRNRASDCTYRLAPFKRIRDPPVTPETPVSNSSPNSVHPTSASVVHSVSSLLPKHRPYPNPGYLGSSSHTALFGHLGSISVEETAIEANTDVALQSFTFSRRTVHEAYISHGAELIDQLRRFAHIPACIKLVKDWLGTGANLSLAGPFTERSLASVQRILVDNEDPSSDVTSVARGLFTQSCRMLKAASDTTIEAFMSQFNQENTRWETLCLFFIAVSRATLNIRFTEASLESEPQRRHIRRLTMHYADRCLETCLSLDCLNDLQLLLQYENFVLHTLVDGDQSFESWRRLGDLSSSLFALGYHQDIESSQALPPFLRTLRQGALAYSYSADKNVSIFLGRPPRILKRFCYLEHGYFSNYWPEDTPVDFFADARWAALCATLKEDIVFELFGGGRHEERAAKASQIQASAQEQWAALPEHFRLVAPMKSYDRPGLELDLMLGIRLNHLHVLFLLRMALVRRTAEPDAQLSALAEDMLSLVVEAVVFKGNLVHSGTSLAWKVVYYGLAAAGVICLSLLQQLPTTDRRAMANPKTLRELGVLIVEVEYGTLVYKEDANYALLAEATRTIKNILNRVSDARHETSRAPLNTVQQIPEATNESWDPWDSNSIQDFEVNFWHTLAEHPSLMGDSTGDMYPANATMN